MRKTLRTILLSITSALCLTACLLGVIGCTKPSDPPRANISAVKTASHGAAGYTVDLGVIPVLHFAQVPFLVLAEQAVVFNAEVLVSSKGFPILVQLFVADGECFVQLVSVYGIGACLRNGYPLLE